MTVARELVQQKRLVNWINDHLCRSFPVDEKSQLALACFDLAIEHHAAVVLLGDSGLYGSLYALLRVEFEAYGRGLWLRHVASEQEAKNFKKDRVNLSFGSMLEVVEKQIGLETGPLSTMKRNNWQIFCSLTHTGSQAIVRRINATHTGLVNYPEAEVVSALHVAGTFALLSATELSGLSGETSLVNLALEKAQAYANNES